MISNPATPEFSRIVEVERIGPDGLDLDLAATAEERKALAARLQIAAVDAVAARAALKPAQPPGAVRLHVQWRADVVQLCVVTLEPVAARLGEEFELLYVPGATVDMDAREVQIDVDAPDPPEPLVGGRIDVGEAVAEHLALALDPYPRQPGAVLPAEAAETPEPGRDSPFEALRRLKRTT